MLAEFENFSCCLLSRGDGSFDGGGGVLVAAEENARCSLGRFLRGWSLLWEGFLYAIGTEMAPSGYFITKPEA